MASVRLRTDNLSKGRKSIYLDVYIDESNHYQKRLKLYLIPEKSKEDKVKNKEMWRFAEEIRNKHELDILNKRFGKEDPQEKYNFSFLEYFDEMVKDRYNSGVNYDTWYSVQKHLGKYTNNKMSFSDITERWLEGFKSYLLKQVSQNSTHTYLNKVKRAIHTAYRERLIEDNPANNVESPKIVTPKREFLTEEELLKLKVEECRYPILKKAFFFSVLTGLRWSDVQNLKWENIQKNDGMYYLVYTQRKTKESERLPINQEARNLLGERGEPSERTFIGLKYSAWHNIAITQWMLKAGITKQITFHSARHTNATLLLNKGVDIYTVSKMLGHLNVSTTQIYAKLVNETKVKAVEKLPRLFD